MAHQKGEYKLQEIDHDSKTKQKDASINTTQTEINNKEATTNSASAVSSRTTADAHNTTPATRANLEPSATVKFVLIPMNQVVTLACSLRMTFRELKNQFSKDLKMDPQHLVFINGKDRKMLKNFYLIYQKIAFLVS
jgi:hypothetical protein